MTRHVWLLPILCFGSAAVTALLMLSYAWAYVEQAPPAGWVLAAAVTGVGLMSGAAHFISARSLGKAVGWGLGIAFASAVLFVAVLTSGFGS